MRGAAVICAAVAATAISAAHADVREAYDGDRDTSRIQLGGAVAVFASYPMSMEDPAGAVFAVRPCGSASGIGSFSG